MTNEFNKYFITSLIIHISLIILNYLYKGIKVIKADNGRKEKNTKHKYIIIFIDVLIFILHIFYMIFLYIFGNIYPNNKTLLLISASISIIFNVIIIIFIIIFASFLMSLACICNGLNKTESVLNEIGEYFLKLI